jgi:hypothetical protein
VAGAAVVEKMSGAAGVGNCYGWVDVWAWVACSVINLGIYFTTATRCLSRLDECFVPRFAVFGIGASGVELMTWFGELATGAGVFVGDMVPVGPTIVCVEPLAYRWRAPGGRSLRGGGAVGGSVG